MLTVEEMRKAMEHCMRDDCDCGGCPMDGYAGDESCTKVMLSWALNLTAEAQRQRRAAETREGQIRERIALLGLEGMFVPKEDLVPDRKTAAALLRRCSGEELHCGSCPLQGLGDQCSDALKRWSAEMLETMD